VLVFTVYIILALLKIIKDNKKEQIEVNYTRVFNINFIGFLIIQLKLITNNLNKKTK